MITDKDVLDAQFVPFVFERRLPDSGKAFLLVTADEAFYAARLGLEFWVNWDYREVGIKRVWLVKDGKPFHRVWGSVEEALSFVYGYATGVAECEEQEQ